MSEPKFISKPGQVDFTNVRYCPVINIVVTYAGQILLVQRSQQLRLYPHYWNGVSGFLDDSKRIEDKVYEELAEELGIAKQDVSSIKRGQVLLQEAPKYHKTWLVVPVLAEVKTENFQLNWEAQHAQWFTPSELKTLKLLPGFSEVYRQFF